MALTDIGGDSKKWSSKMEKAEKAFLASLKSVEKLSFLRRWNVYKFKVFDFFDSLSRAPPLFPHSPHDDVVFLY